MGVGALRRDVLARAIAELHAFTFRTVGARGQVRLKPDDGFDVVVLGSLVELVGAEKIPVVRDRERRHAHALRPLEQVMDARGAIEHRELRVAVQVHE